MQVADVLDFVLLAALLHERNGLLARKLKDGELEVLFYDLLHLGLDRGEVVLANLLALGEVDIVVKAVLGRGAVGKIGLGIEALDGLGHDMSGAVADDVGDLVGRALGNMAVVIEDLHR